jgi:hypothetical protein
MAWSVCARLQQMQRLQHEANLACMHACMVHKIFLGMSQETMIKILTSPNPNILSCTIFSSSPATLEIWERKIQSFLTLSMRVCLCVCTLYRHAEVRPGQDTAAACSTRQSEIHIYSMVYSKATFQSANLQAAKQYLAIKCMYQWLLAWLPSWRCLFVVHLFQEGEPNKGNVSSKKRCICLLELMDGLVTTHRHIEQSRKDMPLLSFSALQIGIQICLYLHVHTCALLYIF